MSPTNVLDIRIKQLKNALENSLFSEEVTICIDGFSDIKIRGIHKWGSETVDYTTRYKRAPVSHWFDFCPYSLPSFAKKAELLDAKVIIGDTAYKVIRISEAFAKYSLLLSVLDKEITK